MTPTPDNNTDDRGNHSNAYGTPSNPTGEAPDTPSNRTGTPSGPDSARLTPSAKDPRTPAEDSGTPAPRATTTDTRSAPTTKGSHNPRAPTERSDATRNRTRLLNAAADLVAERGVERVTMDDVACAAGVGKGTLFRRFGDRTGLLLALLESVEARFHEAYACGPPPLGPGVPAQERLTAFGWALIERIADERDLGAALARQAPLDRRHASETGVAFHRHVSALLREAGVEDDPDMLAHALLVFTTFETVDHLRHRHGIGTARLKQTWADLVRRVLEADR